MTKEEIFEKLQTEVTIRGLSPGTYYTYKRAIDLFLNWSDKPYEELEEIDFRNYLLYLINRGDLTTATINSYNAAIRFFLQVILEKDVNYRRTARLRKEYKLPPVWSIEEVTEFLSVIDNIKRARDDPPQQREIPMALPLRNIYRRAITTKDLREGFLRMFNLIIGIVAVVAIALVIFAIIGVVAHLSKILAFIVGLVVIPATVLYAVLYFISWVI